MIADADRDARAPRIFRGERQVVGVEELARALDERCACISQADVSGGTLKKLAPERLLQPLDARAHDRLNRARRLSGAGYIAVFRCQHEKSHGFKIEHHKLTLS